METQRTEHQNTQGLQASKELSLQRTQPPAQVPGYQIQEFLGSGAYGEVWVGVAHTTGRRVAIKFYTHRGAVDWSLLSREVEKLVYLSADRYVIQLLDVGWDANPPYYVMDYIENGSLNDRLERGGPMSVEEAAELFREVAMGLAHAHAKGVLHCDLKPANVLLDEDQMPRLADFGQSRLTHEQTPSLGTLFFMAPEQADLEAVPDARWDVYALGALFYSATTGYPPYRTNEAVAKIDQAENLTDRLQVYREIIRNSPPPTAHRQLRGMDRRLADIIARCLSPDPNRRFRNVQEVLDALRARERNQRRMPQVVLGIVGPLLLFLIAGIFAWRGYSTAVARSIEDVKRRARETNYFAAKAIAGKAAENLRRYFNAVELAARDAGLQKDVARLTQGADELLRAISDPNLNTVVLPQRKQFIEHPARQPLQKRVAALLKDPQLPRAASWFVCDVAGNQLAAEYNVKPDKSTLGQNFSWRTYFHGGPDDRKRETLSSTGNEIFVYPAPPPPRDHITKTHLSAPFQSRATNLWKIAISTPVRAGPASKTPGRFLGVLAVTVDLGEFSQFDEGGPDFCAVLVDNRSGSQRGMILQHPLFEGRRTLPPRFATYRLLLKPDEVVYRDPLGEDPEGEKYNREWIVAQAAVVLEQGGVARNRRTTGLSVVVQEDYASAIAPVNSLGQRLLREAILAAVFLVLVVLILWAIVFRVMGEPLGGHALTGLRTHSTPPPYDVPTLPAPERKP